MREWLDEFSAKLDLVVERDGTVTLSGIQLRDLDALLSASALYHQFDAQSTNPRQSVQFRRRQLVLLQAIDAQLQAANRIAEQAPNATDARRCSRKWKPLLRLPVRTARRSVRELLDFFP